MAKQCRCGCGEPVKGIRLSRQYVDDAHRQRHRRRRAAEKAQRESQPLSPEVVGKEPARPDPFDERAPGWRPFPGDTSQW
jgi:hypothetical protein